MKRDQQDLWHEYLATPPEYSISSNEAHSTYDQFIQLRDTLIQCNKYYADKAWRSLIIWATADWKTTNTIEIFEPNYLIQTFQPWYEDDLTLIDTLHWWNHIEPIQTIDNRLCWEIIRTWRYRLQHKEQFVKLNVAGITRVRSYILHHYKINNHTVRTTTERAVFDWERDAVGTIKRLTAYWYVEVDMEKWDWVEFCMVDQNNNHIDSTNYTQNDSEWRSIEYLDLPYKKN